MRHFPIPTRAEQEDLLVRLYFGPGSDCLRLCIHRAYLDFSRTLHGIDGMPDLYEVGRTEVKKRVGELRDSAEIMNQEAFDNWHRAACNELCSAYARQGYSEFRVGQAQKWLNMTLKYVYVMGDERLSGYSRLYPLCHVPLDRRITERLRAYRPPMELPRSWSRLHDYELYLAIQRWIRDTFADSVPLAVEFHLWQEREDDLHLP